MYEFNEKRAGTGSEIVATEQELANKPVISTEKLIE
jgi:hypothetical protein